MNFGRHPLPDIQSLVEPEVEQLISEFVHNVQAELARVHEDVQEKMLQNSIRETAKRNANRSPTIQYNIGDFVYLETSAIRKTPALSPLRSGPYRVENVLSNGNTVQLEGFRHPFSVELITPTYSYLGMSPHLTKHFIESSSVGVNPNPLVGNTGNQNIGDQGYTGVVDSSSGATDVPAGVQEVDLTRDADAHVVIEVDIQGDSEGEPDGGITESVGISSEEREIVQDYLEDSQELWEFQPVARVGPSSIQLNKGDQVVRRLPALDEDIGILISASTSVQVGSDPMQVSKDTIPVESGVKLRGNRASRNLEQLHLSDFNNAPISDVKVIDSSVCLPAQLPVSQIEILDIHSKSGSKSSSTIIFTGEDAEKYSIGYRNLAGILGHVEFQKLIRKFEEKKQ